MLRPLLRNAIVSLFAACACAWLACAVIPDYSAPDDASVEGGASLDAGEGLPDGSPYLIFTTTFADHGGKAAEYCRNAGNKFGRSTNWVPVIWNGPSNGPRQMLRQVQGGWYSIASVSDAGVPTPGPLVLESLEAGTWTTAPVRTDKGAVPDGLVWTGGSDFDKIGQTCTGWTIEDNNAPDGASQSGRTGDPATGNAIARMGQGSRLCGNTAFFYCAEQPP